MNYICAICIISKDESLFPPSCKSWCKDCRKLKAREVRGGVKSPRTEDTDGKRKCWCCNEIKYLEMFGKNKKCLNGRERKCKECAMKSRLSNPSQVENMKTLKSSWYQNNKECIRNDWKNRYSSDESFQKSFKEYQRQYYKENTELVKQRNNAWREANPEKRAEYTYRRHVRAIRNGNNDLTAEQIKDLKEQFQSCDYCGTQDDLTLDHVIPLSRGGQNTIENINILCRSCNASKNDKTHEEYINGH